MEQYKLQAVDLTKVFEDSKRGSVTAIDHVNLEGEHGCGTGSISAYVPDGTCT